MLKVKRFLFYISSWVFTEILKVLKFRVYFKKYNKGLTPVQFYSITLFGYPIETCHVVSYKRIEEIRTIFNKGDSNG
jgi:hypothetical protein